MNEKDKFSPEALLAESENETTYFMDFNRQCEEYGENAIYCFVENYDLCFYPHRVEDITGMKSRGIPCERKKNVVATYLFISSNPVYNKYKTLYFVDADFDDNTSLSEHIYVTPCYSIENLYVDKTVVSDILENEYKIRRNDSEGKHEKTIQLFETELTTFHSCVLLFNAWFRTIKRKGIDASNKVNLGDSFPSDMLKLKITSITSNYTITDIENKYPDAPKTTPEEIEENKVYLMEDTRRFRGKYEIQFLYYFFEYLNIDAGGKREFTVLNKGVNWDRKRMISTLDHYVPTPHDMREYILREAS